MVALGLVLHLLDVGQGEAIVLDLPDGDFCLIDAGPARAAATVKAEIERRVKDGRRFRFAAITHWDADHIGGMPDVLTTFPPAEFVQPSIDLGRLEELCRQFEGASLAFEKLDTAAKNIPKLRLGARSEIRDVAKDVQIWALSPSITVDERIRHAVTSRPSSTRFRALRNEASLVLWVRAFNTSILLPGEVDADRARELEQAFGSEKGYIHHNDYRSVWIKLGHHGAAACTDPELLRIFAHDSFVSSASHGAQYGHPDPRVLDFVREANGQMMCTRLGKGCHLIMRDPASFPARDPSWAESQNWNALPSISEKCYGTVSVEISPDNVCTVRGALSHRTNCPYGGPGSPLVVIRPVHRTPRPVTAIGRAGAPGKPTTVKHARRRAPKA